MYFLFPGNFCKATQLPQPISLPYCAMSLTPSSDSDLPTHSSVFRDILSAALAFALVSVLSFSIWAFGSSFAKGPAILYSLCALVFLAGGGLSMIPILRKRMSAPKYAGLFLVSFLAYAILWCAGWFGLRGKAGEIFGSMAGILALCWIHRIAFRYSGPWLLWAGFLFLTHSAGYFLGDWIFQTAKGWPPYLPKLVWGFLYGAGFGAGLGWLLNEFQRPASPTKG